MAAAEIQVGKKDVDRGNLLLLGTTEHGSRPAREPRVYKCTHAKAKRAGPGRARRCHHANEVPGKCSDGEALDVVKASLVPSSAVAFALHSGNSATRLPRLSHVNA